MVRPAGLDASCQSILFFWERTPQGGFAFVRNKKQLSKLKIYNGETHPHEIQKPKIINFEKFSEFQIARFGFYIDIMFLAEMAPNRPKHAPARTKTI